MDKKELTDEEIVKALEICAKDKGCGKCPYKLKDIDCGIGQRSENDYLKLIQRLQKHYANLKERYIKVLDLNEKVIAEQKAEIERLTERNYWLESKHEYQCEKSYFEGVEKGEEQAVKDTAKEILDELFETKFKIGNDYVIYADNIKVFAENYGVEVE